MSWTIRIDERDVPVEFPQIQVVNPFPDEYLHLPRSAMQGVQVDVYGWPVDDENFDLYLRQLDACSNSQTQRSS